MTPLINRISFSKGFGSRRKSLISKSLLIVGGTKYTYNGKVIHTFTNSNNFIVEGADGSLSIEYFIVGGGGSGGSAGGGGGTVVTGTTTIIDGTYLSTVGGAGQASSFNGITANAGQTSTDLNGGNSGIYVGGTSRKHRVCVRFFSSGSCRNYEDFDVGGGGAGAGSNGTNEHAGNGTQAPSTFRDPSNPYGANNFYFGGGGAGGTLTRSDVAGTPGIGGGGSVTQNGIINTGGGGGGTYANTGGGAGASGIIMIAYNA
jgi:hypothetical protein